VLTEHNGSFWLISGGPEGLEHPLLHARVVACAHAASMEVTVQASCNPKIQLKRQPNEPIRSSGGASHSHHEATPGHAAPASLGPVMGGTVQQQPDNGRCCLKVRARGGRTRGYVV
jgi:hypothetical protein